MSHLAILLAAFAGFAALCASMSKHQVEVFGQRLPGPRAQRLRLLGWAGLATALVCAISFGDWRIRVVEWTGAIMLAALAVALLVTYRPLWTPRAAVGAFGAAVLMWTGGLALGAIGQ